MVEHFLTSTFSFGLTMLETAYNIVVPGQYVVFSTFLRDTVVSLNPRGEEWHILRQEDFSQINIAGGSYELFSLIQKMMRADPAGRPDVRDICEHGVVARARNAMDDALYAISHSHSEGGDVFPASPLGRCTFDLEAGEEGADAMDIEL